MKEKERERERERESRLSPSFEGGEAPAEIYLCAVCV